MKLISERLLEERNRLGLNKGQMAAIGGVANSSYTNYEEGLRSPDGNFFAAIASAGADVQYILTGTRTPPQTSGPLNPREAALLDNYRHVEDEGDKKLIERAAFLAAKADTNEASEKKAMNGIS